MYANFIIEKESIHFVNKHFSELYIYRTKTFMYNGMCDTRELFE